MNPEERSLFVRVDLSATSEAPDETELALGGDEVAQAQPLADDPPLLFELRREGVPAGMYVRNLVEVELKNKSQLFFPNFLQVIITSQKKSCSNT